MTDELKPLPCPFCGSIPSMDDVIGEYIEGSLYVRLRCPNGDIECLTEGPWVGFGISDDDYPVDAVTLYESAVSAWNRRVRPDIASIDSVSLMAESVRRGLAEVEPIGIPDWLREKIITMLRKVPGPIDSASGDYIFANHFRAGYVAATKHVLSLRREDD